MVGRLSLLCLLVLVATACGASRPTHGVLGVQATVSQSRVDRQIDRLEWTIRRAQAKLDSSSGAARERVTALTRATLLREADRLERTTVPPRLQPGKRELLLALHAFAGDGATADFQVVRSALARLRAAR